MDHPKEPLVTARAVALTALVIAMVAATMLAAFLAQLWILVFGSVVVAVIFRSIADPLVNRTPLNDGIATLLAVILVLLIIAGIGFLFGQSIIASLSELSARLPGAVTEVRRRLEGLPGGAQVFDQVNAVGQQAGAALSLAPRIAVGFASSLATLLLVVVAGVFLSAAPIESREGVLSLIPESARPRWREVMNTCGRALKGWLKAQLFSMALVGTLVGVGLAIIGVPSALGLALLTGLAQFVPIVGPVISAVPALLLAATVSPQALLLTFVLFVAVSQLEANFITPMVQKNVADLPVVLGIFAVVAVGSLFGAVGVVFATPLALVLHVTLTMFYRQDVLHEDVLAPGEKVAEPAEATAGDPVS